MNFFARNKKWIFFSLIVAAAAVVIPTAVTHAQAAPDMAWYDFFNPNKLLSFVFATFLIPLMGFLVAIAAFVMNLGFELTHDVVNSPLVKTGFSISLYLINLVFVLALIMIAVSTIVRYEKYGWKKLLPTLVTAAIIVNFGLVFAGIFLNVTDSVAQFFITQASPDPSNATTSDFTDALLAQLKPMALLKGTSAAGNFLQVLMNMTFAIIFTFIIAVTLFTVGFLLIYRYGHLSMRLVIMPLQIGSMAIPFYNKAQNWWKDFIKWAMFPPAMLFFLYLALILLAGLNSQTTDTATQAGYMSPGMSRLAGSKLGESVMGFIGVAPADIKSTLDAIVQRIVLILFVFFGLQTAKSMGIAGAGMALGAVAGAKSWATKQTVGRAKRAGAAAGRAAKGAAGATGRSLKRVATMPLRTEKGKERAERWRTAGEGGGRLARFSTGWKRAAGRAMGHGAAAGNALFTDRAKGYEKMSMDDKISRLSGAGTNMEKAALLKAIAADEKGGGLSRVKNLNNYFTEDVEKSFKRFGDEKSFGEISRNSGYDLLKNVRALRAAGTDEEKEDAQKAIAKSISGTKDPKNLAGFFGKFDKDDASKNFFGIKNEAEYNTVQENLLRSLLTNKDLGAKKLQTIMSEAFEKENLPNITETAKRINVGPAQITPAVATYLKGSNAQNLGVSFETVGISTKDYEDAQAEKKVVAATEGDLNAELRNRRGGGSPPKVTLT